METHRFMQTLAHSSPTAHVSHPSGSLSRAGGETGAGTLVGAELVERPGGASGICSLVLLSLFQSFPRHRARPLLWEDLSKAEHRLADPPLLLSVSQQPQLGAACSGGTVIDKGHSRGVEQVMRG